MFRREIHPIGQMLCITDDPSTSVVITGGSSKLILALRGPNGTSRPLHLWWRVNSQNHIPVQVMQLNLRPGGMGSKAKE